MEFHVLLEIQSIMEAQKMFQAETDFTVSYATLIKLPSFEQVLSSGLPHAYKARGDYLVLGRLPTTLI